MNELKYLGGYALLAFALLVQPVQAHDPDGYYAAQEEPEPEPPCDVDAYVQYAQGLNAKPIFGKQKTGWFIGIHEYPGWPHRMNRYDEHPESGQRDVFVILPVPGPQLPKEICPEDTTRPIDYGTELQGGVQLIDWTDRYYVDGGDIPPNMRAEGYNGGWKTGDYYHEVYGECPPPYDVLITQFLLDDFWLKRTFCPNAD